MFKMFFFSGKFLMEGGEEIDPEIVTKVGEFFDEAEEILQNEDSLNGD